ncbi:hypothetical protein SLE2022_144920 [Rubroshorea leprosula]
MGACASVSKNMRDKEAEVPATEPIKEESAEGEHTTKEENKADGEQSLASLLDQQVPAADESEAELPSQAVAAEENKEEVAAVATATEPEKIAVSEEKQTEEQKESN